jgi:predicted Zn-dependent protease
LLGLVGVLRGRSSQSRACATATEELCTEDATSSGAAGATAGAGSLSDFGVEAAPEIALRASEVCRNVGYLCAELERADNIRLQRWRDFSGTIVVHVPRPEFESAADANAFQQAAAIGLRAWNGQPFEILTDTRGDREAHFAVRWRQSLGGSQIGVARTQWSASAGLRVVSIELTTRNPFDPSRILDALQVRLTAAHEMGHALGLPHSDAARDVMYPSNTATSVSAQDYRTMESLYALPDGAEIAR